MISAEIDVACKSMMRNLLEIQKNTGEGIALKLEEHNNIKKIRPIL